MIDNNENTKITEKDLLFIEKELSKTNKTLSLLALTKKLAYQKTSSQLSKEVKIYDSSRTYEIGDFIYKEYDESLMVSSKGVEPFKGAVVLEVVNKTAYEDYGCEMLQVDYAGGGFFRKYMDYMKKVKTQVLLPSNIGGKAVIPEKMEKKEDPRLTELPMTERDLRALGKNMRTALHKSSEFFHWNELWQLTKKQIDIKDEKIKEIENHILEKKVSTATSELVHKFFNTKSSDDLFELYCMSVNFMLEKKHKKDFVYASPLEWGKWHLKTILNSLPENLALSASKATLPASAGKEKEETVQIQDFSSKIYLTWRELLSGGIKIPKSLSKELSLCREYIFTDTEEGKDYTVYHYPQHGFLLGLKGFYENNNVPQGASMTLERKGVNQFSFWLKKSKKKLSVTKMSYDPKEDTLSLEKEEPFTFAIPNKIIHLERETLKKLLFLYQKRDKLDLLDLLVLIFKNFGTEDNDYSLHFLRAYHLVDVLKCTTQEEVEKALLSSTEFSQSEKSKGIFFYHEKIEVEEEPEKPTVIIPEMPPETAVEEAPPLARSTQEAPVKEIPPLEAREEAKEVRVEVPFEPLEAEIAKKGKTEEPLKPKREKVTKKQRAKREAERAPRTRKGEKRHIEEKIELEESEHETLLALKTKEKKEAKEEQAKAPPKEKKKVYKQYVSEEPDFGIFAEKLKTALGKTKKKKK
jgi:hypothetical protein